jgi:superoxide dismutase, Fe-Mn family
MIKPTRRNFIKTAGLLGAASLIKPISLFAAETRTPFELPPLGYEYDALEPFIDKQTMMIHHTKHHQAYINKLNEVVASEKALQSISLNNMLSDLKTLSISDASRNTLRNNGGGHWNHSLFWKLLKKGTSCSGKIAEAINRDFGSMENMKSAFEKAALGQFGSGWAWLISTQGKLSISATPNQDNPLMTQNGTPVLGIDVWEHAYYLKYQNKRADYVKAFWEISNWEESNKIYLTTL